MRASDMLDLLHVYLEEDMIASAEDIHARHSVRTHLYKELYGVDYDGPAPPKDPKSTGYEVPRDADGLYIEEDGEDEPTIVPVDPRLKRTPTEETKPYIPPTEFDHDADDPFAAALSPEAIRKMRGR